MTHAIRALLLCTALPATACVELNSQGCSDTADTTAFRVELVHEHEVGRYDVAFAWEGETAACTYTWGTEDDSDTPHLLDWDCEWPADLHSVGHMIIGLEDLHPETVQVTITRDDAELYAGEHTPDYELYGGERCGEDYFARETVTF